MVKNIRKVILLFRYIFIVLQKKISLSNNVIEDLKNAERWVWYSGDSGYLTC